jgi:hypothetical protein
MATRVPRQSRGRTRLPKTFQPIVPSVSWTASIVSSKVRLVASVSVTTNGVPKFTVQGVNPTAITIISATTFDLTYATAPVTTNVFVVDANDPAVRAANGGYLAAGQTTF